MEKKLQKRIKSVLVVSKDPSLDRNCSQFTVGTYPMPYREKPFLFRTPMIRTCPLMALTSKNWSLLQMKVSIDIQNSWSL